MSTTHVIQFLIQSAGLSLFTLGIAGCARRPERRASAALIGILTCGLLPFLTSAPPVRETVTRHQVIRVEIPQMMETAPPAVSEEPLPSAEPIAPSVSAPAARRPLDWHWMTWLLPAGVSVGLLKITRDVWMARRWSASLSAPDDAQWARIAAASPETMSRSAFRVSNDGSGPCLVGFWKPRIALPDWMLEPRKNRELEWAIRHEGEHLRTHDSRWIVAVRLMTALHWWNPFMHLLAGNWDQSRERVCDLKAAGDGGERSEYGHFILGLAAADQPRMAATMAVSGNAKRLRKRIDSLLGAKHGVSRIGTLWRVAMIGLMCGAGWICSGFGFAQEKAAAPAGGAEGDMSWLEPKPVVRIRATAIISPAPLARNGEVMTQESSRGLIERAKKMKNTHVVSLGNARLADGMAATIQLTANRDDSLADPPWDGEKQTSDFVGWVLRADTDGVELQAKLGYAYAPGSHPAPGIHIPQQVSKPHWIDSWMPDPPQILPLGVGWHQVKFKSGDCKCRIESDQAIVLSLGEVEKGTHAICLIEWEKSMPWQPQRLWDETDLVAGRANHIRVETRTSVLHPTQEQKRADEELRLECLRLESKVEQLPENQNLLKLRHGLEDELRSVADDHEARGRLQWKIDAIRARMRENCPMNLKVEIQEIQTRRSRLNAMLLEELIKREREESGWPLEIRGIERRFNNPDPTKFNHQEQ